MGIVASRGRRLQIFAARGIVFFALAGCAPSAGPPPELLVPAGGVVTYRGHPVAEAQLTFLSDDSGEPPTAQTDAQGRFRCTTNDSSEGIAPGDYVVILSHPRGGIPEKYARADSSTLHVTVEDGGENEFAIILED